ncbi:MAG: lasso peptide biosynthesis B2 protein [Proteobacteria bacterium]|nr:lasso peptide biosynthesis B2 protein [Pseudomonadota bacterium]NDC25599.1 lasso peptide biosynthesis B2 protein [Pseudomonadota bacterium]NDD05353.1 lasso peptide biosynthesis B2 protein [Pseudomonadota bacterium]NDG26012.1 lasso peptide biosynthesis B2 protein [Pseudomonadota bacterium]
MNYAILYVASFLSTKFLGLDRTITLVRWVGLKFKRFTKCSDSPQVLEERLQRALEKVPLAAKCLDQAVVTWYVLNLHGHPAILRIGISLTPLESHAWVAVNDQIFVDTYNIPDLKVVAEYGAWII